MEEKIFAAYSDESGCFNKRYQAIGVVSGNKNILSALSYNLFRQLTLGRYEQGV